MEGTYFSDEAIFKILKDMAKVRELYKSLPDLQGRDKLESAKLAALIEFIKRSEQMILAQVSPNTYKKLVLMDKDDNAKWRATMYSSLTKAMENEKDPKKKAGFKEIIKKNFPDK